MHPRKNFFKTGKTQGKEKRATRMYSKATQDRPKISYKMQVLAGPKRAQAAYYLLKLGKGFFKQFPRL
jgi:hypothetical protein